MSHDDDEKNRAKGPAVVCNFSLSAVQDAVRLRETQDDSEEGYVTKLITRTAQKAVTLCQLSASPAKGQTHLNNKLLECLIKVDPPTVEEVDVEHAEVPSNVSFKFDNEWLQRYKD